ncbi:MAG TPA: lantibiotic dehydratase [Gemmatimonadales bacterium]|nr:lantibiotic dehydratase [Gemmatimonadales bacterium]
MDEYVREIQCRDQALANARLAFEKERVQSRNRLWEFTRADSFQRGLLLASQSLFSTQKHYADTFHGDDLGGKERRLERGLLRYALRTAVKATPFATLCVVCAGRVSDSDGDHGRGVRFTGRVESIRTVSRLNKSVLAVLVGALGTRADVRKHLRISLNPTITADASHHVFLTGSWRFEAFQKVGRTPLVDLILEVIKEAPNTTYEGLAKLIAQHPAIECSIEEADAFVGKLLAAGVISARYGINEQEADWGPPFCAALAGCTDEYALSAAALVRQLGDILARIDDASAAQWPALIREATSACATTLTAIGQKQDRDLPPIRTDGIGQGYAEISSEPEFQRVTADLCKYVESTIVLAAPRVSQASMRHFFDTYYPRGKESVSVLTFYEDYYRQHFREHLRKLREAAKRGPAALSDSALGNPFKLSFIDEIVAAYSSIGRLVQERWRQAPDSEEVHVTLDEIANITKDIRQPSFPAGSIALFGNFAASPNDGLRFVTKNLPFTMGHGHFFSRWLHALPELLKETLAASSRSGGGIRYAEICGDNYHNANLHPRLLPWEITYPNAESELSERSIDPTDLLVSPDPEDPHALRLIDQASGERVVPIDLGFVAIDLRPPLYRLLSEFAPPSQFQLMLPQNLTDPTRVKVDQVGSEEEAPVHANGGGPVTNGPGVEVPDEPIIHRPRVVIGRLVASRRQWIIPKSRLPIREHGESDFAFHARLSNWRADCDLPEQAFARLDIQEDGSGKERGGEGLDEPDDAASRDPDIRTTLNDRKPQFFDFNNPLMGNIYAAMLSHLSGGALILEERYPTREMLPVVGEERRAVETIIQLELKKRPAGEPPVAHRE